MSATLEITTIQFPAPTWILTRTGNASYWAHGALQPGQQACAGAGARHSTIDSHQPGGFPEQAMGCVRNLANAQLNFEFNFFWF